MAVRYKVPARGGRRVSLSRAGTSKPTAKNVKKTIKKERSISFSWSRMGQSLSLAGIVICGFIVISLVSLVLLYGYRYFTTNEYFSLKNIEIQGNIRLSSRDILEIAKIDDSSNSLAVSITEVESLLRRALWIEEVSVRRVLPDTLVIGVKERQPVFWALAEGTMYYADEVGSIIAPVQAGDMATLPTLVIEPGAEDVAKKLPVLMKSLRDANLALDTKAISFIRLSASRAVELNVENSHLKVSIGLEEWYANLDRLGKTLTDLKRRGELQSVREIKAQGTNVWVEKANTPAVQG